MYQLVHRRTQAKSSLGSGVPSETRAVTACTSYRSVVADIQRISMSTNPSVPRSSLASDLRIFQSLSPSSRTALALSLAPAQDASSALDALNSYAPSTATPETSQTLIASYIKDMREDVLKDDGGREEGLGRRIDQVREQGQEIQGALGNVKP